jgi:hypothetical protein
VELYDEWAAAGRRPGIVATDAHILEPGGIGDDTFAERWGWTEPIDYDSMLVRNYILARALFSRVAYDEVGGLAPECLSWDDYDLWLRMMEAGYDVIPVREPLVVYRYHPGSMSRDEDYFSRGALAAYGRILERGVATPRQRRVVRAQMRHYRALRERARFREAVRSRQPLRAVIGGMRAAPHAGLAFLQAPSRWGEWTKDLLRGARKLKAGSDARS